MHYALRSLFVLGSVAGFAWAMAYETRWDLLIGDYALLLKYPTKQILFVGNSTLVLGGCLVMFILTLYALTRLRATRSALGAISLLLAIGISLLMTKFSAGWAVLFWGGLLLLALAVYAGTRVRAMPIAETWDTRVWFGATIGLDILLVLAFALRFDFGDSPPFGYVAIQVILARSGIVSSWVPPSWIQTFPEVLFALPVILVGADVCTWIASEVARRRHARVKGGPAAAVRRLAHSTPTSLP